MREKLILSALFFSLIFLKVSGQEFLYKVNSNLEGFNDSIPWINKATIVSGEAKSGVKYSAADSVNTFGFGYKGAFPSQCQNKNLKIILSESLRTSQIGKEFGMVISVSLGDSMVSWNYKNSSEKIKSAATWVKIKDEISIPVSLTGPQYKLEIYLWNKDGHIKVDIDDIEIVFEEISMPSFLPVGFKSIKIKEPIYKSIASKSFNLIYFKKTGAVKILNESGDTLISSLAICSEWSKNYKKGSTTWINNFELIKDSMIEKDHLVVFSAVNGISKNEVSVLFGDSGKITFSVAAVFTKSTQVRRHSLIAGFAFPVTQVYKKNTLEDTTNIRSEYWLGKEGFTISNGSSSLVIYKPENVSSLQLDTRNKLAVINMDYMQDHPLLHFPLLKKSENKFVDYSASVYNIGDKIESTFSFYSVKHHVNIPRLLENPYGFLSSFIWTEHADYTDLRTHKAVYFGSDRNSSTNNVTGGFLKYSIPVTKSIFYANPDSIKNSDKSGFIPGPIATLSETEGFRSFLKQLEESGIEICLHTPDHLTCTRNLLNDALQAARREFASVSWIDHGYDNSEKSNREDLNCDGADTSSKYYAADLWKKYGVNYLWNSYFEDAGIFAPYGFNSFLSVPYSGWDDAMPTPVYWKHRTRTADIVHWRTTNTLDLPDGSLWSYYFNDLRLNDMVKNRNTIIIHSYPARVDSTNGFYDIRDGVITANEEFNKTLERLSSFRHQDKIRLTTVREMLDYRTSIEKISYEVTPDGSIIIQNNFGGVINGITFSAYANGVEAVNKQINSKKVDGELVFWFDMMPGEQVNLLLK